MFTKTVIIDFLFRNQITKDVVESMKYLLEKIMKGCSNDPKVINMPLVREIFAERLSKLQFIKLLIYKKKKKINMNYYLYKNNKMKT